MTLDTPKQKSALKETGTHLFNGAISGFLTGALMQPVQVIKTSMQVSPIEKVDRKEVGKTIVQKLINKAPHKHYELLGFTEATRLVYSKEGVKGFYRGFTPSIIKNSMNAGTYFAALHFFVQKLQSQDLGEHRTNTVASAMARVVQSVTCNPLVVIKTRMEVLSFNEYSGLNDAIRKIYSTEGLGGFFTGLKVSLIRDVPFSGVYFPIYSFCKKATCVSLGIDQQAFEMEERIESHDSKLKQEDLEKFQKQRTYKLMVAISLASFAANFFACMVTHPLDLIRTRIYFQKFNKDKTQHYQGIFRALLQIYQYDGLIGYFRGITPRIMRKGIGSIITWVSYEYLVDKSKQQ